MGYYVSKTDLNSRYPGFSVSNTYYPSMPSFSALSTDFTYNFYYAVAPSFQLKVQTYATGSWFAVCAAILAIEVDRYNGSSWDKMSEFLLASGSWWVRTNWGSVADNFNIPKSIADGTNYYTFNHNCSLSAANSNNHDSETSTRHIFRIIVGAASAEAMTQYTPSSSLSFTMYPAFSNYADNSSLIVSGKPIKRCGIASTSSVVYTGRDPSDYVNPYEQGIINSYTPGARGAIISSSNSEDSTNGNAYCCLTGI